MTNDLPRILIVEDDAVLRRGLARTFSSDEFEVLQFSDGGQAVDSVTDRLPDLILCDYRLPGADGLEILGRLEHRRTAIPFILITAHFSEELEKTATELGAAAVLEKPIDLIHLKDLSHRLLDQTATLNPAE